MIPFVYHPMYSQLDLPDGHRYPINKYRLLYQALCQQQQADEHWLTFVHHHPNALTLDEVKRVHQAGYVDDLAQGLLPLAKMRRIGFPWSERLIERTLLSAGGTANTLALAWQHGMAIHLSGGYHHAHYDFGSGFCLFNDLVLAAEQAIADCQGVDKVLIIDSDVHHGDGTAALCQSRDDIITLSFHCEKNFPSRKPESDLDVPMAKGVQDEEFLEQFKQVVDLAVRCHQPDVILYDAGVDIHQEDELGYLHVSTSALYQRDHFLFQYCQQRALPVAAVVGGGYRTEHGDLVPLHWQLLQAAFDVSTSKGG